jgi:hypothetical protein
VIPGVRIEGEKTGVAADEPLPFVRPSDACFRQPALCQSLTKSKSCAGAEIELVRVPHPDAALKRLVQFRPGSPTEQVDLVADVKPNSTCDSFTLRQRANLARWPSEVF